MATIDYVNMSVMNMTNILGDYNEKSQGVFNFWFVLLMGLYVIILSTTLPLGTKRFTSTGSGIIMAFGLNF